LIRYAAGRPAICKPRRNGDAPRLVCAVEIETASFTDIKRKLTGPIG
jgi:hypothetical protein